MGWRRLVAIVLPIIVAGAIGVQPVGADGARRISFSTFFGGGTGADRIFGLDTDASGNVYVTGITFSSDFPTTRGAFQRVLKGSFDAFVAKFSASGQLMYSTLLGGGVNGIGEGGEDAGSDIAVDREGNAYVVGHTNSDDFPIEAAAQSTRDGSAIDAFVTKLDPTGSDIIYSTFISGRTSDEANAVDVAPDGSAWVGGATNSFNFPTQGAYQSSYGGNSPNFDGFITQVAPSGGAFTYSTYFGGGGDEEIEDVALHDGNVYVSGDTYAFDSEMSPPFPTTEGAYDRRYEPSQYDAFVTKFASDPSRVVYSTLLGGRADDEENFALAIGADGSTYVTGSTHSIDFPTKDAFQARQRDGGGLDDAYLTRVNPSGSGLIFSTYFGGEGHDLAKAVAVDAKGNATIVGRTSAGNLIQKWTFQPFMNDYYDGFVATFGPHGSLRSSNFLGGVHPWDGSVDEETLDAVDVRGGSVYLAGHSAATYPVRRAHQRERAGGDDAVITKLALLGPTPRHGATLVLNRLRRHIRFSGRIVVTDGFDACRAGRRVVVEISSSDGPWVRLRAVRTDRDGRYNFKNQDLIGRYRVEASSVIKKVRGRWHRCGADRSRIRVHRH
ncbi:MAG TPA: SBBP repeat-containing protein [Actinomycetota bacterium]|nr:SBBP repeat-containing protein [Actinomycetota bacterium]